MGGPTPPRWGTDTVWRASGVSSSMEQEEDRHCGFSVSLFGVLGKIFFIYHLNWNKLLTSLHPKVTNSLIHALCSESLLIQRDSKSSGCIKPLEESRITDHPNWLLYPLEVTEAFFPSVLSIHFNVLYNSHFHCIWPSGSSTLFMTSF